MLVGDEAISTADDINATTDAPGVDEEKEEQEEEEEKEEQADKRSTLGLACSASPRLTSLVVAHASSEIVFWTTLPASEKN